MSVILDALRSQKKEKNGASPPAVGGEGLVWGEKTGPHREMPPSTKTISILLGLFVGLAGLSIALWLYNAAMRGVQAQPAPVAHMAAPVPAPSGIDKIVGQARTSFQEGRYDESEKLYQDAIALDPKNAALRNNAGMALLRAKHYDESEKQFESALALDKKCVECLNNLGYLKGLQGNPLDAEKILNEAIALDSDYPDPYFNLGVLYENNDDIGRAIVAYEKFLHVSRDKNTPLFLQVQEHVGVLREK